VDWIGFESYLLLGTLTFLIFFLSYILYTKTQSILFPLASFLLYYWSLFGSWMIILDRTGGDSGMHYHYLQKKMFPIVLDGDYLKTMLYYGIFILTFQFVLLLLVKPRNKFKKWLNPIEINHTQAIAVGFFLAGVGLFSSLPLLGQAMMKGISLYRIRALSEDASSTFYFLLLRASLLMFCVSFATFLSGKDGKYFFSNQKGVKYYLFYLTGISAVLTYSFLLGRKNDSFCVLISAVLFYIHNNPKFSFKWIPWVVVVGAIMLGFVDKLRGVPIDQLGDTLLTIDLDFVFDSLLATISSNEGFGAHFSMYGVLAYDVPMTYGTSFLSLATILVPKFFSIPRFPDVYEYYQQALGLNPNQGYTIHHATGWYLNFGILGVVIAGIVLGGLLSSLSNLQPKGDSRWRNMAIILSPILIVGYFPAFVRGGIEVYKPLILEGLIFQLLALGLCVSWRKAPLRSLVPAMT